MSVVIFVKNYNTVFPSGRQRSHFGRFNRTRRPGDVIFFPLNVGFLRLPSLLLTICFHKDNERLQAWGFTLYIVFLLQLWRRCHMKVVLDDEVSRTRPSS